MANTPKQGGILPFEFSKKRKNRRLVQGGPQSILYGPPNVDGRALIPPKKEMLPHCKMNVQWEKRMAIGKILWQLCVAHPNSKGILKGKSVVKNLAEDILSFVGILNGLLRRCLKKGREGQE